MTTYGTTAANASTTTSGTARTAVTPSAAARGGGQGPPVVPVILCGSNGARPFATATDGAAEPDDAAGDADLRPRRSPFQQTALLARRVTPETPVVVCNVADREIVKEQVGELGLDSPIVVCEPSSRGSAAAMAAAAAVVSAATPDALLLVLPPTRRVRDARPLVDAVASSTTAAREGYLVMFGVPAGRIEPGQDYLRRGEPVRHLSGVHAVDAFADAHALGGVGSTTGDDTWLCNTSFSLFSCRAVLAEIDTTEPRLARAAAIASGVALLDRVGNDLLLDGRSFSACPRLSVESALMERSTRSVVVTTSLEWSRPATTPAGARVPTQRGAVRGDLGTIPRGTVVERPWGSFEALGSGSRHQVKHLVVAPGQKLSLQRHRCRSEHWVVVSGTARFVRGEDTYIVGENQSLHIPAGCVHRIENPADRPLHVVEVQVGDYLGEDDIERLADDYGRA